MQPKTFLVGVTQPDFDGLREYLTHTDQLDFLSQVDDYLEDHPRDPLCLVSFYAKLCYRSLVLGKNANVSRVRDMEENLVGCLRQGHGSVFEHVTLNFVTTGCSRVFTHELVRHRVGTAFSQTSGRYCTVEDAELVLPPELEETLFDNSYITSASIADDMRRLLDEIKRRVASYRKVLALDEPGCPMGRKKRLTSALRRIMPNGAANEIGWSVNVRSLRHLLEMRTSAAAEWEIRLVFGQVYDIVRERWPLMVASDCEEGAVADMLDGVPILKKLKV